MDIIVVTRNRSRTWQIALTPSNLRLWLPLSLGVLSMVMLSSAAGWAARGKGQEIYVADDLSALWSKQVANQRKELETAKAEAEENARVLSQKLAQLQAHVLRLDAAGGRMTEIAGLDPSEFNFSAPPAVGGPEAPSATQAFDGDPILAALESFEQKLDDRDRQMRVLEDILMTGRLHREMKPSGWPVSNGYVSSTYGWRADPFNGRRTLHQGIDFAATPGSGVLAVAAGIVTEASPRSGYGLMVEINHGNGYVTRYGHNRKAFVQVGQKVDRGEKIASVGSSGRSTGPHVHFEVLLNGFVVNPAQYIRAAQ